MWRRFAVYGAVGWLLEVLLTGTAAALHRRDRSATARTFLWMHPIYGTGGVLLELVSRRVKRWPRPLRAFGYLPFIYGVEWTSGWLLRRLLGRCPWDYGRRGLRSPDGLVRFDYAPIWLAVGLLFEPIRDVLTTPEPPTELTPEPATESPREERLPADKTGPTLLAEAGEG